MRGGSLRRQLIGWNILALALLLAVLGLAIRFTVRSVLIRSVDSQLVASLRDAPPLPFGGRGPGPPFGGPRPPPPEGRRRFRWEENPYGLHHFDLQGRTIVPEDTRPMWDPEGFRAARGGREQLATVAVQGEPIRVISRPAVEHGEVVAVIQTAYPLTEMYRALGGLDRALLTLIPVGLIFAGLGGAFLTDRVLRRVRIATRAAREMAGRSDFAARLPVAGSDEFSELAETFNRLLARLETAFQEQTRLLEQQRRFTADASHELKTPLTVIRGTAGVALAGQKDEGAYRRSLEEIDRAAESMSRLVQDLLLLARSDAGQLGRNPIVVAVREILDRAVDSVPGAPGRITLEIYDEGLCVRGNEGELVRLFANLIDNAVKYSPPDAPIQAKSRSEEGHAVVRIIDSGPGIPPEHLAHLGERFYRIDAARAREDGGTGLGLSIARGIAAAHGGTLDIQSAPGKGTVAAVRLPAISVTSGALPISASN